MRLARTIPEFLVERARQSPGATALVSSDGARISAEALLRRSRLVAAALSKAGVGAGARILVGVQGGHEATLAALAAACWGQATPLTPTLGEALVLDVIDRLRSSAALASNGPVLRVARARGIPVVNPEAVTDTWAAPLPAVQETDVAFVLTSSGTEGRSRVVPLTHGALVSAARAGSEALGLGPADSCLDLRPAQRASSIVGAVLTSLVSGGAVIRTGPLAVSGHLEVIDRPLPTCYTPGPPLVGDGAPRHQAGRGPRGGDRVWARWASPRLTKDVAAQGFDWEAM